MHKTLEESQALITEVRGIVRDEYRGDGKVVLIPTFLALPTAVRLLEGSGLQVGAQNAHQEDSGAFTGEISSSMLKSIGVEYCLVGHSERRQYFGETNEVCAAKVKSVVRHGMKPIFCVGETLEQRESKQYFRAIEEQIVQGLFHLDRKEFAQVVVAYEPVWAIGTGKTCDAAEADRVCGVVRAAVAAVAGDDAAAAVRIQYGGSMKPDNASELLGMPNIDGGLIGGASLKAGDFAAIVAAAK